MLELGKSQVLEVVKTLDFGVYLAEDRERGQDEQVLLPIKQVPAGTAVGDRLQVFLYRDSSDRLIATTAEPKIKLGEIAMLSVAQIGQMGAFLDWGLEKDLFLPYREQTRALRGGDKALVALYVDKSQRLCATMRLYHYLRTDSPWKVGDRVEGTAYEVNEDFGVYVAVDNLYSALIPKGEARGKGIQPGDAVNARVSWVHEDGKLNLSLRDEAWRQIPEDAEMVIERISAWGGRLPFTDRADPQLIQKEFGLSKKAFKRAVGTLLKEGRVEIGPSCIILTAGESRSNQRWEDPDKRRGRTGRREDESALYREEGPYQAEETGYAQDEEDREQGGDSDRRDSFSSSRRDDYPGSRRENYSGSRREERHGDSRRNDRYAESRRDDRHGDSRRNDRYTESRREDQYGNSRRNDRYAGGGRDERYGDSRYNDRRDSRYSGHRDNGYNGRSSDRRDSYSGGRHDSYSSSRRDDRYAESRREDRYGGNRRNDRYAEGGRDERYGDSRYSDRQDSRYSDRRDNRYNSRSSDRRDNRYNSRSSDRRDSYSGGRRDGRAHDWGESSERRQSLERRNVRFGGGGNPDPDRRRGEYGRRGADSDRRGSSYGRSGGRSGSGYRGNYGSLERRWEDEEHRVHRVIMNKNAFGRSDEGVFSKANRTDVEEQTD